MDPILTDDDRPPAPGPRRVHRGVLWASALAVVVLAIATFVAFTGGSGDDAEPTDPAELSADGNPLVPEDRSGEPLPDLTFDRFDGSRGTLGAYAGRPLVINFWASWCAPCIAEMPAFERVHQAAGDGVAFLGLNVTDGNQPAEVMIERTGVTYDLGRDPTGDVLARLGGVNMPTTVFVRADGTIASTHAGQLSEEELTAAITDELGVSVTVPPA